MNLFTREKKGRCLKPVKMESWRTPVHGLGLGVEGLGLGGGWGPGFRLQDSDLGCRV